MKGEQRLLYNTGEQVFTYDGKNWFLTNPMDDDEDVIQIKQPEWEKVVFDLTNMCPVDF